MGKASANASDAPFGATAFNRTAAGSKIGAAGTRSGEAIAGLATSTAASTIDREERVGMSSSDGTATGSTISAAIDVAANRDDAKIILHSKRLRRS